MSYTLAMGDNAKRNTNGDTPWNITAKMRHWRDSVKDFGGYWDGSGTYWTGENDPLVSREEAIELFRTGLAHHIVRTQEGRTCWEGRITTLTLTLDGVTYQRDLSRIVNRAKLIYSFYTGDMLYDGSHEQSTIIDDGVIANRVHGDYGGTTTWTNERHAPLNQRTGHNAYPFPIVAESTTWVTHGKKSLYVDASPCIVVDGGRGVDEYGNPITFDIVYGGGVQFKGSLAVDPSGYYYITADINVSEIGPTGVVHVSVNDATNEQFSGPVNDAGVTGIYNYCKRFQARSDAAGVMNALIVSDDDSAKFYIDHVTLRAVGVRKETPWLSDPDSIAEYGTHEEEIVAGGMTDAQATAHLAQLIAGLAWPRTRIVDTQDAEDGLTITAQGYVTTMASQQVSLGGVKACNAHITDMVGLSEFVTAGYIETNALNMYIDENNPNRLWDSIQTVVDTGGTGGARWICGVYAGRKLNYEARPATMTYKRKGDRWLNADGTEADPQQMRPGIVLLDDMHASGTVYTNIEDDARYIYVSEWEYDADTDTASPLETRELLE